MESLKSFVRRRRNEMGLSQTAFGKLAGVEGHTIWQIERGATKNPKSDTVQGLARALSVSPEQIVLMLREDRMRPADDHELLTEGETKVLVPLDQHGRDFVARFRASGKSLREFMASESAPSIDPNSAAKFLEARGLKPAHDDNVDRAPRRGIPIPEWESEVAAGHWIDCVTAQLDAKMQGEIVDRGMFIIRVRGDSMLPDYEPGCRVLFRIVRLGDEPLLVGEDYCFQTSDGQCTLKTLRSFDEDELVLAPRNPKYKPLRLPRQMLARASIVEGILTRPSHAMRAKG